MVYTVYPIHYISSPFLIKKDVEFLRCQACELCASFAIPVDHLRLCCAASLLFIIASAKLESAYQSMCLSMLTSVHKILVILCCELHSFASNVIKLNTYCYTSVIDHPY